MLLDDPARQNRTCLELFHSGAKEGVVYLSTESCMSLCKATPGGSHFLAVPTCLAHLSGVTVGKSTGMNGAVSTRRMWVEP